MQLGITAAATKLGLEMDIFEYLAPRDRNVAVGGLVGMFGLKFESLTTENQRMRIQAEGPQDDWMPLAASLSAIVGDHIETLELHVDSGDDDHVLSVHLPTFTALTDGLSELTVLGQVLRMADIASRANLDGKSILSPEKWQETFDYFEQNSADLSLSDWIKSLRRLREAASRAGMDNIASQCTDRLAQRRKDAQSLQHWTLPTDRFAEIMGLQFRN